MWDRKLHMSSILAVAGGLGLTQPPAQALVSISAMVSLKP